MLDFSDRTFSQFFASEFGIDIDDPKFADQGTSKGKRLRRFLQLTDDATAAKVLRSLWECRKGMISGGDPVANADARFGAVLAKVSSGTSKAAPPPPANPHLRDRLRADITALSNLAPQPRGYAFEKFLNGLLELNGLDPRGAFRIKGEQIDGSFTLANSVYLLEAKWQSAKTGATDLHAFEGKLGEKAAWVRGLFVSYVGFTEDGLAAFGRGKRTLCMDGFDLYSMLERDLALDRVLEAKARRAAETGLTFVPVWELF